MFIQRLFRRLAGLLALVVILHLQAAGADAGVELLATDWANDRVLRIDTTTSLSSVLVTGGSGGLDNPAGLVFGPSETLLVASGATNNVKRYQTSTGASVGTFATGAAIPIGMEYGPDGRLYVASRDGPGVYRYNGNTGQSLGLFATAPTSDLWWAYDLAFLPGGDLLVSSFERGSILRFSGSTGAYLGQFSPQVTTFAAGLAFGPTGDLFVARYSGNKIDRIHPVTGQVLGTFASGNGLNKPSHMVFAPDGRMYVANERSSFISIFDSITGSPLGTINTPSGGLQFLLVVPEPGCLSLVVCAGLILPHRRQYR